MDKEKKLLMDGTCVPHILQHIVLCVYVVCYHRVAFRTTPMDDTGVPHILEHTVLCGSEKYPVRDPFFKMLTRSQSTFMNAFTCEYMICPQIMILQIGVFSCALESAGW